MSTARPTRTRRPPDERRESILDAAGQVALSRGLHQMRVGDVAEELGVSHGLVHYYFPTKDDLVAATMRHLAGADAERLRQAVDREPTASAKLDRILVTAVPSHRPRDTWALWLDAWSAGMRDETVRQVHEELDDAWTSTLVGVIRDGIATREFDCQDPEHAATRLTALIDGLCLRLVLGHHGIRRDTVLALLRESARQELGMAKRLSR